jgi:threonyl-tRNA synthetase
MKILCIHADYMNFKPLKKAIPQAEKIKTKETKLKECLVVFSSVEKNDEINPKEIAKKATKEIIDIAKQVKTKKILLYPFVHLSATPSSPKIALDVLENTEKLLKEKGYSITRSPFGYYKTFTLKCKGHPLSELSREFSAEKAIEEIPEEHEEDGILEKLFIILPDGKIKKREEIKKECPDIEIVIKDELGERKSSGISPPHLKLMKQLEIASIENRVSDAGNLRYFPKGYFILELLRELCWDIFVKRLHGMPVQTPCIVSKEFEGAKWMMDKFPERLYKVLPGKVEKKQQFYLRPACDYGVFSMFKDALISYKNLPLGLYEYEYNSWRYEQRGELLGMYRIRSFIMADIHTICADLDQAFKEYENQIRNFAIQIYNELDFKPVVLILNCKKDFFDKYKSRFQEWAKNTKLPIIVKLFSVMKTYKIAWVDAVAFDALKRCMEVTTVQLDAESPQHWGITYTGKDGKNKYPLILHTGVGLDRTIAALLEDASAKESPMLPLWISPTQVRIIPVSIDKHLKFAEKLANKLEKNNIRVDIDDNTETISKRVRNAEKEWIPYILIVGDKEINTNKLIVRDRKKGKQIPLDIKELIETIKEKTKDMPFKSLPLPKFVSKRPIFSN